MIQLRSYLKTKFVKKAKPCQSDFWDWLDSSFLKGDDEVVLGTGTLNRIMRWNATNGANDSLIEISDSGDLNLITGDIFLSGDQLSGIHILYDNTISGLSASNVQDAIDEVDGRIDSLETDKTVEISSNDTTPGFLEDKIVGVANRITISTLNDGLDEDLQIDISATYIGQSSITTLGTITTGIWNGTTIAIANGGTGQTNKTEAFDNLSPTTTKGDLIVHNGTDNVRLPVAVNGFLLITDNTTTEGVKWTEDIPLNGTIEYNGELTPPAITGNTNNYSPTGIATCNFLRVSSTGNYNITGLLAPSVGNQGIYFCNVGSNIIIIKNNDINSTPANRFLIGGDKTIQADEGIMLIYDQTSLRWRSQASNI